MTPPRPEEAAREEIHASLTEAGWVVQDMGDLNLAAGLGVAVREFYMAKGYGRADYLLFVEGQAVGALEAKKAGHTLIGVEAQVLKYGEGLPSELDAPIRPLPLPLEGVAITVRIDQGVNAAGYIGVPETTDAAGKIRIVLNQPDSDVVTIGLDKTGYQPWSHQYNGQPKGQVAVCLTPSSP